METGQAILRTLSFTVVLCLLGAVLLLLAFGGHYDGFGVKIGITDQTQRYVAGALGALAIMGAVLVEMWVRPAREGRPTPHPVADGDPRSVEGVPGLVEGALFALDDAGIPQLSDRLKGARRVSMIMRSGVSLFNQYEELFKSLLVDGCEARVILCDPQSPVARTIYGGSDNSLQSYIGTVQSSLKRIKSADGKSNLNVRLVSYAPTFSLMMIEHQEPSLDTLQVSVFFTHTRYGRDRPNFILGRSNRWFPAFVEEFEEAWKSAIDWKLS